MTKILVTGIKESSKDTVLDLVLKGSKHILPSYKFVDVKPIIKRSIPKKRGIVKKPQSFDDFAAMDMIKIREMISKDLESELSKQTKKHLIVSGYFTIRTKAGYVPLFTDSVFNKFKPDIIITLELETNPYKSENPAETVRLMRHQQANRMLASSYAALFGSIMKTIVVREDNIKHAIKELSRIIEFYLGI